jgi:hypothetical protein
MEVTPKTRHVALAQSDANRLATRDLSVLNGAGPVSPKALGRRTHPALRPKRRKARGVGVWSPLIAELAGFPRGSTA